MTVNFDNAATTFPKPEAVRRELTDAVKKYGGNAGRGGHALAMRTSAALYSARETAANFFGAQPENTVFAMNCTHALNMAIQGVMSGGGHMIISSLEHNAVARPAAALAKKGNVTLSVAEVFPNDEQTVESFRSLIRSNTKAIVCTLASNVTGQILPYKKIAELCRARNICFIADGAQACGVISVKLTDGINILCTSGHKGLYGITGTGLLVSDGKFPITPIMQGGTGSLSQSLAQPDFLPDALESGTPPIIGAMSVKAGIEFIEKTGIEKIFAHEERICRGFISELSRIDGIKIYREDEAAYVPIVSFNIGDMPSEEASAILAERGYCLRAGFHCAALAHAQLGTKSGTIRFAPSFFSSPTDAASLASYVKKVKNSGKA